MGWSDWFTDNDGEKVKVKNESKSDGSVVQHFLRSFGGDKSDHSHTVVHHKSSGKSSAHHNPRTSSRK